MSGSCDAVDDQRRLVYVRLESAGRFHQSVRKSCLIVHCRRAYRQAFRSHSHWFAATRSASIPCFQQWFDADCRPASMGRGPKRWRRARWARRTPIWRSFGLNRHLTGTNQPVGGREGDFAAAPDTGRALMPRSRGARPRERLSPCPPPPRARRLRCALRLPLGVGFAHPAALRLAPLQACRPGCAGAASGPDS